MASDWARISQSSILFYSKLTDCVQFRPSAGCRVGWLHFQTISPLYYRIVHEVSPYASLPRTWTEVRTFFSYAQYRLDSMTTTERATTIYTIIRPQRFWTSGMRRPAKNFLRKIPKIPNLFRHIEPLHQPRTLPVTKFLTSPWITVLGGYSINSAKVNIEKKKLKMLIILFLCRQWNSSALLGWNAARNRAPNELTRDPT